MKKFLLLGAAALTAMSSFAVVTDGITYEDVDNLQCTNKWFLGRTFNLAGWNALPFADMFAKARTACVATIDGQDKIVVGWSKTMTVDEKSDDYAHIVIINFSNGTVEKTLQLTCDGQPIKGLLCANNVGCDAFGNVWVAGYVADANKTPINVYHVKNFETGECELVGSPMLSDDDKDLDTPYRLDYMDILGDVTGEKANTVLMSATASVTTGSGADAVTKGGTIVIGYQRNQGEAEWGMKMGDGEYNTMICEETYPAGQTNWGTAPYVYIVRDEEFSGDLVYVDGFTTCPSLYNTSGAMLESFASASDLAPLPTTNGVAEFSFSDEDNFIVYSLAQYDKAPQCAIRVAKMGAGNSMEGMQDLWMLPQDGIRDGVSDSGTRVHAINPRVYTDAEGNKGAYILSYKCNNLLAVYTVAQKGWKDPDAGVQDVIADDIDANAPVQYFNLQGVEVSADNMAPGMYIARQGSKSVKKLVK